MVTIAPTPANLLALPRPVPGPGGRQRPLWLPRADKPDPPTYRLPE